MCRAANVLHAHNEPVTASPSSNRKEERWERRRWSLRWLISISWVRSESAAGTLTNLNRYRKWCQRGSGRTSSLWSETRHFAGSSVRRMEVKMLLLVFVLAALGKTLCVCLSQHSQRLKLNSGLCRSGPCSSSTLFKTKTMQLQLQSGDLSQTWTRA